LIDDDVTAPGELGGERLALADGVELLGPYQGSGFRDTPYLLKRGDGQVVQVTRLIYLVATCLAAGYHLHQVANRVSTDLGRTVSVENIAYLVNRKLRPAGLLADPTGADDTVALAVTGTGGTAIPATAKSKSTAAPSPSPRADALLALKLRVPLVPARLHAGVTRLLTPLFRPLVVAVGLAGLVAMDAWLVLDQRDELADGVRQVIYRPQLMLLLTALTLLAGAFHETGHATAARYGGATPGAMGAGVYLVWPVFYTDVTDSYRLSRRGRLRTDLGGVWFNVLFTLGIAGAYLATGLRPLLVYLVLAQLETLRQFLPFVRLDGYYVISDLAGVPNLFAYVRPVMVSLLARRRPANRQAARAKLDELTTRARRLVTAWVLITVPVLLGNVVLLIVLLPRLAGAAWGSAGGQLQAITGAGGFDAVTAANGLIGLLLLAIPVFGMVYVAGRLVEKVVTAVMVGWRSKPAPAALVTAAGGLLAAWQVGFVWPDAFGSALEHAQRATVPAAESVVASPSSSSFDDGDGPVDVGDIELAAPTPGTSPPTSVEEVPSSAPKVPDVIAQTAAMTSPPTDPAPAEPPPPEVTAPATPHPGARGDGGDRPTPTISPSSSTTVPPTAPPTTAAPNLLGDLLSALFG